MALGAGNAHAEEDLRQHARRLTRLAHHFVEIRRSHLIERPFGGHQFADKLIIRLVGGKALVDPVIKREGPLVPEGLTIHPQQVGPFKGPVIRVLRPLQKLVHEIGASRGRLVAQEAPRFRRRGQGANNIEIDAAQVFGVFAHIGRDDVELFQLGMDRPIDEVVLRQFWKLHELVTARHERPEDVHLSHEAGHDGCLPRNVAGADQAKGVYRGQRIVVGLKAGMVGDVGFPAIAGTGHDA